MEIEVPTYRVTHYDPVQNDEGSLANIDLVEEKRKQTQIKEEAYKWKMVNSYNKKLK